MKRKRILYHIVMYFPLLVTLAVLPFLPEQIPAHYGFDNQVTRWGSKYEALIYPITAVFLGYFMLAMAKLAAKQEENGKNNEQILMVSGIALLIFFNVMNFYMLYTDFNMVENLSSVPIDIYQILFGVLGGSMIIIGNVMPKLRMNSIIGLRTRWSMENETTWKKSQRFGGISFIAGGFGIILICFFIKGFPCLLCAMGVIAVLLAVDVYYTYRIARKK